MIIIVGGDLEWEEQAVNPVAKPHPQKQRPGPGRRDQHAPQPEEENGQVHQTVDEGHPAHIIVWI